MNNTKQTADGDDYKPGQTKELNSNAADTEALTTFYETLYRQTPDSKMAAEFLLKHGLLEYDEADELNKKMGKVAAKSAASSGGSKPKAKPKATDDDFEAKPKKAPAKKAPAKKASIPKDDDSSDEEFEAKKKPAPKAAAKPAAKKPAAKKPAAGAKRPVPEDSSDEDETPLSQKTKAKK